LSGERKETGFLEAGEPSFINSPCNSWELITDTNFPDEYLLPIRPIKTGKQLVIDVALEDVHSKVWMQTTTLVDSGCMRTCIDADFARERGLTLMKIPEPIKVEYADGTIMEKSTIKYAVNVRIRAARATVVTGALATQLKSSKLFLGYDWLKAVNLQIDWRQGTVHMEEGEVPIKMRTLQQATPDYQNLYKKVFSEEAFQGLPPRWK
jgi:hypothetical protein